jgi:hypothetical protein
MADVREQILDRLRVLGKVRGVSSVLRNEVVLSDGVALPAVILYDGDEDVAPQPNSGRPALTHSVITMKPWFQITNQADAELIGESLNELRLRLIKAVLNDTTLVNLSAENRSVRYAGAATKFQQARAVQGDMAVQFQIGYYLRTADLA